MTQSYYDAIRDAEEVFNLGLAFEAVSERFPRIDYWDAYQRALSMLFADIQERLGFSNEQVRSFLSERERIVAQYDVGSWFAPMYRAALALENASYELQRAEHASRLASTLDEPGTQDDTVARLASLVAHLQKEKNALMAREEATKERMITELNRHALANHWLWQFVQYCDAHREYFTKEAAFKRQIVHRIAAAYKQSASTPT